MLKRLLGISVILILLVGCSDTSENPVSTPEVVIKEIVVTATPPPVPTKNPTPKPILSPTKTPTPTPTSTPTPTTTPMPTPTKVPFTPTDTPIPTVSPTPTSTATPASKKPYAAFGDGIWLVLDDIVPGTYETANEDGNCYWARLSGVSGTLGEIVANENAAGHAIVAIDNSDKAFESRRCGEWKPLESSGEQGAVIIEGTWVVNDNIAPATYETSNPQGLCYWVRLSGFSGELNDILANANGDSRMVVTIKGSDTGFASTNCGQWTLLGRTRALLTSFSDGTWVVGEDIVPGTYVTPNTENYCYWARLSGFGGELEDIKANGVPTGRATVAIEEDDIGFSSSGCGTWIVLQPTPTPIPTATPTFTPTPAPISTATPTMTPTVTPTPAATSMPTSIPNSLLDEISINNNSGDIPNYERSDWKHWTDSDNDCQNTRHEVLIEESLKEVEFKDDKHCQVLKGVWIDLFTGKEYSDPSKLDIDHMVPLKNVHISGGWDWSSKRKELYANDLNESNHLIAVSASANRSKGSKGPEDWRPSDKDYWCEYATDWMSIKIKWELTVTNREFNTLKEMLNTCSN